MNNNNNGFWEFACEHPIMTVFGITGALSGIANIIRAVKGVPGSTIKINKDDGDPNVSYVITNTESDVKE